MRVSTTAIVFCAAVLFAPIARATDRNLLSETTYFHFYSDLEFNQHNYLYGLAQTGSAPVAAGQACLETLTGEARQAWAAARELYNLEMANRHHRRDPLMRWLRLHYSGLGGETEKPDGIGEVFSALNASRPAYVACFWESHSALNKTRAAEITAFLDQFGEAVADRLASIYRTEWPRAVVVDLLPYSDNRGASTVSGRDMSTPHITTTSNPDHLVSGIAAFEILFHEASHDVFGPRHGYLAKLIIGASEEFGVRPPRDLWHGISFYTTGHVIGKIIGVEGFQPYWAKSGVFARAWPDYLAPIDVHWKAVLTGDAEPGAAIRSIIEEITGERE